MRKEKRKVDASMFPGNGRLTLFVRNSFVSFGLSDKSKEMLITQLDYCLRHSTPHVQDIYGAIYTEDEDMLIVIQNYRDVTLRITGPKTSYNLLLDNEDIQGLIEALRRGLGDE